MAGEQERWEHTVLPAAEADRLGTLGDEGWQVAAAGLADGESVLYLKRRAPDFRERVTLAQREVVLAQSGEPQPESTTSPAASAILHPGLAHLLARTGHTDYFTVCDRGFPVPEAPERIDLALVDGIPSTKGAL